MNNLTYGFADELLKLAAADLPIPRDAGPIPRSLPKAKKGMTAKPPAAAKIDKQIASKTKAPAKTEAKKPEGKGDLREVGEGLAAGGRIALKAPVAALKGAYWTGDKLTDMAGAGAKGVSDAVSSLSESDTGKKVLGAGRLRFWVAPFFVAAEVSKP